MRNFYDWSLSAALAFIFSFGAIVGLNAQTDTRSYLTDPLLAPREHAVDFTHLKLEVSFVPEEGLVKGKVTETFTPLHPSVDSIVLDGTTMRIKTLLLNGKQARFKNDSSTITIYAATPLKWGSKDSIAIEYEVNPRKGLYFIGWNDKTGKNRKQIWSQGQSIDNRCWIPMYDEMNDKVVSEMLVTFKNDYRVISNGICINKKENKDGTTTWHYAMKHPHAPYLIMLAIGNYDVKELKSKSGIPIHLYYYPDWKDRVDATYKYSAQMIDFYEQEIGVPYGWESYSQIPVQDFMYGAMENTTATVFGDFYFVDERAFIDKYYIGVNAHELAHQWFGDLVTARCEAHHWLQESFATYYNEQFEGLVGGEDQFNWARRLAQTSSLAESEKNNYPVAHSEGGTVRHYPKGAFVLHMLKYVVGGREAYNKAIKYYLEKHKYENVDSHDLLEAFEESLGYSLDWFWEEWIYKGGEPAYKVNFESKNDEHIFTVTQTQVLSAVTGLPVEPKSEEKRIATSTLTQKGNSNYRPAGLYSMPIVFEIHYTDGSIASKRVVITNQVETVSFQAQPGKQIDYVLFDPNNEVLKSVSFEKPFEQLKAQALKAASVLDRYDAIVAMRSMPLSQKRELFYQVFAKETFHAVKAEIVGQLAADTSATSTALLQSAMNDKEVLVRKAAFSKIGHPLPALIDVLEKHLNDSSYEAVVTVLERLLALRPSKADYYLDATKNIQGAIGLNVHIKWLELAYNIHPEKKEYLDQLVAYAGMSYEFRIRMYAYAALKRLDYFDSGMISDLAEGICNGNVRLSTAAADYLNYFYAQSKYHADIRKKFREGNWLYWQKKLLEAYL